MLSGVGQLHSGPRQLGPIQYEIDTLFVNGLATIVKFARRPPVRAGEKLHLTLEDGRMLDCQVLNGSPFCAVLGLGPYEDRRREPRTS
jgi:hypothetical protein